MVIWVLDPYKNLEISPGIRARIDARVEPSMRIGLYRIEQQLRSFFYKNNLLDLLKLDA